MATPPDRFWSKVDQTAECWLWTASVGSHGYGQFWSGSRWVLAHRFSYELLVSAIPAGLTIDHLCRHRLCVNPEHLEPVTHRENVMRGKASALRPARSGCRNGHPATSENTHYTSSGKVVCLICRRRRGREYRQRQKVGA